MSRDTTAKRPPADRAATVTPTNPDAAAEATDQEIDTAAVGLEPPAPPHSGAADGAEGEGGRPEDTPAPGRTHADRKRGVVVADGH